MKGQGILRLGEQPHEASMSKSKKGLYREKRGGMENKLVALKTLQFKCCKI